MRYGSFRPIVAALGVLSAIVIAGPAASGATAVPKFEFSASKKAGSGYPGSGVSIGAFSNGDVAIQVGKLDRSGAWVGAQIFILDKTGKRSEFAYSPASGDVNGFGSNLQWAHAIVDRDDRIVLAYAKDYVNSDPNTPNHAEVRLAILKKSGELLSDTLIDDGANPDIHFQVPHTTQLGNGDYVVAYHDTGRTIRKAGADFFTGDVFFGLVGPRGRLKARTQVSRAQDHRFAGSSSMTLDMTSVAPNVLSLRSGHFIVGWTHQLMKGQTFGVAEGLAEFDENGASVGNPTYFGADLRANSVFVSALFEKTKSSYANIMFANIQGEFGYLLYDGKRSGRQDARGEIPGSGDIGRTLSSLFVQVAASTTAISRISFAGSSPVQTDYHCSLQAYDLGDASGGKEIQLDRGALTGRCAALPATAVLPDGDLASAMLISNPSDSTKPFVYVAFLKRKN